MFSDEAVQGYGSTEGTVVNNAVSEAGISQPYPRQLWPCPDLFPSHRAFFLHKITEIKQVC